jgi:hypothetical protein
MGQSSRVITRNVTGSRRLRALVGTTGLAGAIVLALTGCTGGSGGGGASSAPTTSTPTTSASSAAPASAAPTTSSASPASGASDAAAAGPADGGTASGAGTCAASSLAGSIVDGGGGGAGSVYLDLALRNTGSASCTLQGWPGVSFVGDGIGAPAKLDRSGANPTVTLAPGQTASAPLRIVQAANLEPGNCTTRQPDGFRVYPPGSKQSLFIASTAYTACRQQSAELLSVRAFVPEGQQQ